MEVIWKARLWQEGSGALVSRENIYWLDELGANVFIEDMGEKQRSLFSDSAKKNIALDKILQKARGSRKVDYFIRCAAPEPKNPHLVEGIWEKHPEAKFNGMYVTLPYGYLPKNAKIQSANILLDTILCPSDYIRDSLIEIGLSSERVAVAQHGFDPVIFNKNVKGMPLNTKKNFLFLHVSIPYVVCKGIDLLLSAYFLEFSARDDVALVLQTWDRDGKAINIQRAIDEARSLTGSSAEVVLINAMFSQEKLAGLYRACNAYVQTSRVEGFGLPVLEAMGCGLHIITVGAGGHMQFCNDRNSLITEYRVSGCPDNAEKGLESIPVWIEADVDHLRFQMRRAYNGGDALSFLAETGYNMVHEGWTWRKSAERILSVLRSRV